MGNKSSSVKKSDVNNMIYLDNKTYLERIKSDHTTNKSVLNMIDSYNYKEGFIIGLTNNLPITYKKYNSNIAYNDYTNLTVVYNNQNNKNKDNFTDLLNYLKNNKYIINGKGNILYILYTV